MEFIPDTNWMCLAVDPKKRATLEGVGFAAVGAKKTVNLISVEVSELTSSRKVAAM